MVPCFTRRHALRALTSLGALALPRSASPAAPSGGGLRAAQAGGLPADQSKRWKGSALGNLYPFIKQEQQRTRQRLAFLNRRPMDVEAWKAECRDRNLANCYDDVGKPERFQTFTFDGPQTFPLEAQQRMMAWFDRWV
jgi:hypothetical protein